MNAAEKALAYVVRYERAAGLIAELTGLIRDAINRCHITGLANESENPGPDTAALWDGNRIKNHLYFAFTEETACDSGYGVRRMDEGEQEAFLSDEETGCEHCLNAWRHIMARKEARKQFGRAKASIRMLGKRVIAAESQV